MKYVLLAAIWLYRRLISPYKGFACARRVATGGESCSAYGRRVIARHGAVIGMALLRRRMRDCGGLHERAKPFAGPLLHRQRGECDLDVCDVCDVSPCDLPSCDLPSCDRPSGCRAGGWRWIGNLVGDGCCNLLDCSPGRASRRYRRRYRRSGKWRWCGRCAPTSAPALSPPP